jgi:hypothetical protein
LPHNGRIVDPGASMFHARHPSALTAATLALLVCVASGAALLPPLVDVMVSSTLQARSFGATLVLAMLLHWVFLGIAAQRQGRHAVGWVLLSVLLFPIGSAAALVLLGWQAAQPQPEPAH